jgi:uncharacterized membrane protein YhiD involved in acid resistance
MLSSIIENGTLTMSSFLLATAASLVIGFFIAWVYSLQRDSSRSYLMTLVLLPAIVQVVIMLVNGNIGAGVAVAGAFSLVRFRSEPGSGQEITGIFLAMATGLATGMGYLALAAMFAVIMSLVHLLLEKSHIWKKSPQERVLRITVPENLDYEGVFDDILRHHTDRYELTDVKTTNMGSLYKLEYQISLKPGTSVKTMMDSLRERNGNLEISCGRPTQLPGTL